MTASPDYPALVRRVDGLVGRVAKDQAWGKALFRQFNQHCTDDETRHKENVQTLAGIENAVRDQGAQTAAAIARLTDSLDAMTPTFRRLRERQKTRRAVIQCLSRWRGIVVGFGISAAALFVWFDGHWPRIAAKIRWLVGPG